MQPSEIEARINPLNLDNPRKRAVFHTVITELQQLPDLSLVPEFLQSRKRIQRIYGIKPETNPQILTQLFQDFEIVSGDMEKSGQAIFEAFRQIEMAYQSQYDNEYHAITSHTIWNYVPGLQCTNPFDFAMKLHGRIATQWHYYNQQDFQLDDLSAWEERLLGREDDYFIDEDRSETEELGELSNRRQNFSQVTEALHLSARNHSILEIVTAINNLPDDRLRFVVMRKLGYIKPQLYEVEFRRELGLELSFFYFNAIEGLNALCSSLKNEQPQTSTGEEVQIFRDYLSRYHSYLKKDLLIDTRGNLLKINSLHYQLIRLFNENPNLHSQSPLTAKQRLVITKLLETSEEGQYKLIRDIGKDLGITDYSVVGLMERVYERMYKKEIIIGSTHKRIPHNSHLYRIISTLKMHPELIDNLTAQEQILVNMILVTDAEGKYPRPVELRSQLGSIHQAALSRRLSRLEHHLMQHELIDTAGKRLKQINPRYKIFQLVNGVIDTLAEMHLEAAEVEFLIQAFTLIDGKIVTLDQLAEISGYSLTYVRVKLKLLWKKIEEKNRNIGA